jgi:membrane-bound serine protease (ClpP class)
MCAACRGGVAFALAVTALTLAAGFEARAADAEKPAREESVPAAPAERVVHRIVWDDAITPVSRDWFSDAIERAEEDGAAAVLIELDTPGGLLDATRDIVSRFYESGVPVIVWVSPSGARAASAGVFLTMAAHVAAMAPGTNIGAASPVTLGGAGPDSTMAHKMFEDTAAFLRSIAERRGRSVEWAERAVRDARSLTESEALQQDVVDFVARDVREVLELADGRTIGVPAGDLVLHVAGARVETRELTLRYRILALLANPNFAYILLLLGIYGVFFELSNPGSVLPGVVGAIFLILAFWSMQTLPLNLAGLLLIAVGLVLFLLEAHVTSFGLLTIGGVIASVLGAIMLFDSPDPALRISLWVILPLTLVTAVFFAVALGLSVRTMRTKPVTGREGMIGLAGVARTRLDPSGTIEVRGELWGADSEEVVEPEERVRIVGIEGLRLRVRKG